MSIRKSSSLNSSRIHKLKSKLLKISFKSFFRNCVMSIATSKKFRKKSPLNSGHKNHSYIPFISIRATKTVHVCFHHRILRFELRITLFGIRLCQLHCCKHIFQFFHVKCIGSCCSIIIPHVIND